MNHQCMTEQEVIEWIEDYLDATNPELTAKGMILNDIEQYTFEVWLDMPDIVAVQEYLEATEEVAKELVKDYKNMLAQEQELDEMGIMQTLKIDPVQSMDAFRGGVMDVFRSLLIYLQVKEQANALYQEHKR
jgi:hypothetical protein